MKEGFVNVGAGYRVKFVLRGGGVTAIWAPCVPKAGAKIDLDRYAAARDRFIASAFNVDPSHRGQQ